MQKSLRIANNLLVYLSVRFYEHKNRSYTGILNPSGFPVYDDQKSSKSLLIGCISININPYTQIHLGNLG